jgi:hypothetical protein
MAYQTRPHTDTDSRSKNRTAFAPRAVLHPKHPSFERYALSEIMSMHPELMRALESRLSISEGKLWNVYSRCRVDT